MGDACLESSCRLGRSRVDFRYAREAAAWERLTNVSNPSLPIGPDPAELRVPITPAKKLFAGMAETLVRESDPFFGEVLAAWKSWFPTLPAWPGRMSDMYLYLYVKNSGRLFMLRRQLPAIRAKLATLPHVPNKLVVRLEIHNA